MKRKDISKRLASIILVAALTLASSPIAEVNAATLDKGLGVQTYTIENNNYFSNLDEAFSFVEGDEVIYFMNQEDLDLYKSMKGNQTGKGIESRYGEGIKTEVQSSKYEGKLWIGEHSGTTSWTKASSYTLTKSKTYSTSGSYTYMGYGINTGFSYTNSVATTIPADSSRFSKLGTWGDFTFRYNKYIHTSYGVPTGVVTYGVSKTMSNHYVEPIYQ